MLENKTDFFMPTCTSLVNKYEMCFLGDDFCDETIYTEINIVFLKDLY